MRLLALTMAACLILAGCSSTGGGSPLIPNKTLQLTATTSVSLASLAAAAVVGAAAYVVYDPLAPNWEIEESKLNEETYRLSLKMKRFHTGGAGESLQIFKRRAVQLQFEQGYGGYQILEYTEGIDSQTIGARRVGEGVVRMVQRRQADSFLMN
jgi:opacity protein-like surface antigen